MINNSQPAPATRDGDIQREILHVLRGILKQLPPRYSLTVDWVYPTPKGNKMSFLPKLVDPTLVVGQTITGIVTETETKDGVTGEITPSNLAITFDTPGVASGVVNPPDPTTGAISVTLTALAPGSTNVTVADTVNAAGGATATYPVTDAAAPPSFTLNVDWQAPVSPSSK